MRALGVRPNSRSFGKLMEAAAKALDLESAELWFTRMRDGWGFEANIVKYGALVHAAAMVGDAAAAEAWLIFEK